MRQLSTISFQLSAIRRRLFFVIICSLFTVHCSLFTAHADEIKSKAALAMEASTGRVLFAKNPNLKLPPASTTKLVTAMVVLDRTRLNETVTISEKAAEVPTIKGTGFKAGETVTVETLLYAALLRSANGAAFALAEHVAGSEEKFVELMNRKVVAIGASGTKFINTTGLPGKGQQITAYGLAKILRHALKYPVIREIIGTREAEISTSEGRIISLENTNKLLWSDDGAVGGKTGYTRSARHCFVYAGEREGETVIVAILGAPSRKALWDEAEKLVCKGFDVIASAEQPVIYYTKADYTTSAGKTAYKKNSRGKRSKYAKASAKKKSKKVQATSAEGRKRKRTEAKKIFKKEDQKSIRAGVFSASELFS
ncbi:MAG: D-alanyl-D-alanine carboxypeptidase [Nitrospirae bacterium]|nr:MAG: D-alanyl-D-alanine carboxypeptidase [Nitrospirota bacterium]